ncbi:MAG: alkaline phosphatase [Asgard group archaeon]|nr:alkaline phosphatase [Asgard group archaeon]
MKKQKINFLLIWFVIILTIQLAFGFKTLASQSNLNNRHNIAENLSDITQIDSPTAITDQILILFVDGMRYDKMLEANTPNMDKIMDNGTSFSNYFTILPSYSTVNYAAFSTGSSTNLTNVYSNGFNGELKLPTLYSLIDDIGLNKSLITGGKSWIKFLGVDSEVVVQIFDEPHSLQEGAKVRDAALTSIAGNFSKIQFIGFEDVDAAGHEFGAASATYIQIIENIDSYIGEILDLYDSLGQLENTTILLFSDHGHDDKGGHGDSTFDQTHGSFILAGKGVTNKGLISDKLTRINFITPTLLSMLGIPLGPAMNGQILSDFIDTTIETKAIYAIQEAEIMNQQLNATLNEFRILSNSVNEAYSSIIETISINISDAKADYFLSQYTSAFDKGKAAEDYTRLYLSALIFRLKSLTELIRTLLIIGICTLVSAILFYLNRRKIIDIGHQEIFTKEMIIPQIIGMVSTISICIIICAIFRFSFSATSFNSVGDTVPPILISYFVSAAIVIFLPWFIVYLIQRKKMPENSSFKDWKSLFLKSTIGSIFFISLPIIGYMLYVMANFGPWPNWILYPLGDIYAYMIIGILPCLLYLVGLILMLVLWRFELKKNKIIN